MQSDVHFVFIHSNSFLILVCYYQGINLQENLQNCSPTLFLEDRHCMSLLSRVSVDYCPFVWMGR